MKLLLLMTALASLNLFAGLPKDDFVVDAARESFKKGFSPSIDRTLPNKGLWVCGRYPIYSQQSGSVGVTLGGIKFNYTSNGLMGASAFFKTDVPYYELHNSKASYRFDKEGNKKFYHFVRENHGGLIIERARTQDNPTVPSIIMPELQVTEYTYCLPYEKSTSREKVFNHKWDIILKN